MRMHCVQHVPFEGMAGIEDWANGRGYSIGMTRIFEGEELPLPGSFDWLVVMGGPMSTGDETAYPWLKAEKRFIRSAVGSGKIVLGVCLGAQLLSESLGGIVAKNPDKEIGWFPVKLTSDTAASQVFKTLPQEFIAFQWHGDTFSIPPGARKLASSEACEHQAFEIGRAVGLQFHLESSKESIEKLLANCPGDLDGGRFVQDAGQIRAGYSHLRDTGRIMGLLLDSIEREYVKESRDTTNF